MKYFVFVSKAQYRRMDTTGKELSFIEVRAEHYGEAYLKALRAWWKKPIAKMNRDEFTACIDGLVCVSEGSTLNEVREGLHDYREKTR